ncbi:ARM repeat superfamily protein [Actinidia rufa]|uniref:ARM repeat superfamily protein n=1 Tax=Actinidia rufa TaxID=165716 RepID=A0A7J0G4U4_9ERIC|nr:ARM repeat superfamily protein [Actinidia rufa]
MEEIEEDTSNLKPINFDEDEESRRTTFSELKSYSLDLLDLLQNPRRNPSSLSQLHDFLSKSSPHSVQPFFDYTLFPLLLLLDAAVDCRSPPKLEESVMVDPPKGPHKVSDVAAEGVLQCLEELLKKCHLRSVDQMVVVLKKLTYGAMLSPSEASEEFREGVFRCFRALFLNLDLCANKSCSCKQTNGSPILLARRDMQSPISVLPKYDSETEECLLAFLHSHTAAAAVGHWLSLLLKAADVEVARGHRGSAKVRVEAFMTLRILVAKVGTADALAFFLPGVVSQFAKVLHVSKTMISGAAGNAEAIDQSIRGLAEFLMIVLEDDANLSGLGMTGDISTDESAVSFLEELRSLPVKTQGQSEMEVENLIKAVGNDAPNFSFKGKESVNLGNMIGSLHECLCVLVCDDSQEVSSAAQVFLGYLFSSGRKHHIQYDFDEIFSRLIAKIPKVVLGSEESLAVSEVQKLLVVIYFSGPQLVADHLLQSPVTTSRFLDVFALCFSQNSVFAGSLDKLISARPSSTGYLRSITEMRASICFNDDDRAITDAAPSEVSKFPIIQNKRVPCPVEDVQKEYELPRMPPWFVYVGSRKLYQALAGILRLVGSSLIADSRNEGSLSIVTDVPLGYLRKLISEVRMREHSKESWQSWYSRVGSGQLVRQATTAICLLNEIIFGVSDKAVDTFARMFQEYGSNWEEIEGFQAGSDNIWHCKFENPEPSASIWKTSQGNDNKSHLIDCVGSILHEYLAAEVWSLPLQHKSFLQQPDSEVEDLTSHFYNDAALLYQEIYIFLNQCFTIFILLFVTLFMDVIIDGIGIFSICLGRDFSSCGFLHSSLYLLLENLICSNFQIRRASDAVLHVIAATCGYPTVGHLVLANSDYVIDSICRQLRHLDLNPHVPNVLASMLSYIGLAHKILPLLEEPMRSVSLELEILGRHQHAELTIPFMKAVAEITKASKREACSLPAQSASFLKDVKSEMSDFGKKTTNDSICSELCYVDIDTLPKESVAATPLLTSLSQGECLIALDIVEDGILALAKVEESYKDEKKTKEAVDRVFRLCSFHSLKDTLDASEDETDENRLLPAMNKIWPFLVACIRNKNPLAVRRCAGVISNVVCICGGDFFSRRFYSDGSHFWKLLSTSPFQAKPVSKEGRAPLQLPYRSNSTSSEVSMAEVSNLKVQAALLNMIADLSREKRSASALEAVLKKISGIVVGIACSGVVGLREASMNALVGLASIDPDLIWLLLADVYYSKKKDMPSPPTSDLPEVFETLPPPSSPKGYLYVQYGGQSYGFDIDFSSVEAVFKKLHSQVFISQMYS